MSSSTIPQVTLGPPILVMEGPEALTHQVRQLGLMGINPALTLHAGGIRRYLYVINGGIGLVLNDDADESPLGQPKFGISLITPDHEEAAAWLATSIHDGGWGAVTIRGSQLGLAEKAATFIAPFLNFMRGVFVVRVEDKDMGKPAPIPFVVPEDWATWNGEN